MDFHKILKLEFWTFKCRRFHELYDYDLKVNAIFRGVKTMSRKMLNNPELKYIKYYRRAQATQGTIWFKYFYFVLIKYSRKTGIGLYENLNIPRGLVIGHAGTIVISGYASLGENLMISHGVSIGRDFRGIKKGVPSIGNNVSIKCNSTIVGDITIGDDVLIAPNTFVDFDVPPHSIVKGGCATILPRDNSPE